MNIMKKVLMGVITLALALSLAACGGAKKAEDITEEDIEKNAEKLESMTEEEAEKALENLE